MTDLQSLYAGICAQPDEDTPRLALADFLDEQGGKENVFRADFIRTHCQLSREEPWSEPWRKLNDKWQKLHSKATDLALKHKLPWVLHLKGRIRAFYFERGLVGELTLFSKRFVNEGASYFEQDPIRGVKFVKLDSTVGTVKPDVLFQCPYLARLAKLDLDGSSLTDAQLSDLGASPHLKGLKQLALGGFHEFGAAALPKLLKALPGLSELTFYYNWRLSDGHLSALAKSPDLARIKVLNVSASGVGAKGVSDVLKSKHATGLTEFSASGEQFFEESEDYGIAPAPRATIKSGLGIAEAVAAAPALGNLQELDLGYRAINDAGAKLIAGAAKKMPALRRLRLAGGHLTVAGLKALAESDLAPRLLYLDVVLNPKLKLDKKQRAALKGQFPLAHIEESFDYAE